jgi:hypothetical protein
MSLTNYSHLDHHIKQFLVDFNAVSFPKGFGFDHFSEAEVDAYFSDPAQWHFSLNKETGKGLLYGKLHTQLRQHLLNGLEREDRLKIVLPKFNYIGLDMLLKRIKPEAGNYSIEDVLDIGMAHSLYRIVLRYENGEVGDYVVKRDVDAKHSFFSKVLNRLGWPNYNSGHFVKGDITLDIMPYLGGTTAYDALTSGDCDNAAIIDQLAMHAALGDILGRGDRHFENYIVNEGKVYPIDVSFLFWPQNEAWLWKYIAGGMTEYSVLNLSQNSDDVRGRFWLIYTQTMAELQQNQHLIYEEINAFFDEGQAADNISFIQERLGDVAYINAQKKLYEDGFEEYLKRLILKEKLAKLVQEKADYTRLFPTLKMYYLADLDRLSAFYLLEDNPRKAIIEASL